jgi:hypothetical protein
MKGVLGVKGVHGGFCSSIMYLLYIYIGILAQRFYVLILRRMSWRARGFLHCLSNSRDHFHGYQSNSFSGNNGKLRKTCFTSSSYVSSWQLHHCSNIMLTSPVSTHFFKPICTLLLVNATNVVCKACTQWLSTDDFVVWSCTHLRTFTRVLYVALLDVFAVPAVLPLLVEIDEPKSVSD